MIKKHVVFHLLDLFFCVIYCVFSSFAIISLRNRELITLHYCKLGHFRENFNFASSVKTHICDVENSRQGRDLPISVDDRVDSPIRDKTFAKILKYSNCILSLCVCLYSSAIAHLLFVMLLIIFLTIQSLEVVLNSIVQWVFNVSLCCRFVLFCCERHFVLFSFSGTMKLISLTFSTQHLDNVSKTCLTGPLKRRSKLVFKTDYRFMQVKSIA